jgi:hypothetical protein
VYLRCDVLRCLQDDAENSSTSIKRQRYISRNIRIGRVRYSVRTTNEADGNLLFDLHCVLRMHVTPTADNQVSQYADVPSRQIIESVNLQTHLCGIRAPGIRSQDGAVGNSTQAAHFHSNHQQSTPNRPA